MTLYFYSVHNKIYVRYCGVLWAENMEAATRAVQRKHDTGNSDDIEVTTIMKKGGK